MDLGGGEKWCSLWLCDKYTSFPRNNLGMGIKKNAFKFPHNTKLMNCVANLESCIKIQLDFYELYCKN